MAQLQTTAITGSVSASAEITAVSFTSSRATGVGFFGTASFALTASGATGTSGTSGTAGSAGTSGSSGTSGSTGSSGSAGTAGSSGTSGTRGSSGSSGTSGANGSSGSSGATGGSGSSGSSGATGASGSSGSAGSSGTSGTRGSSGSSGTTGANGSSGSSGTSASVTINNNTDNYLVTATGTTNTLNGEANLVFNGSNLGIGTTAPVYTLHLAAADTQNTYPTTASINITNTNSAAFSRTMGVNFSVGAGAPTEVFAGIYGVYTNYTTTVGGAIAFVTNNGSNSFTEKMRIISNGNVGIGTTTIPSRLSISGSSNGSTPVVDIVVGGTDAFSRGVRMINSSMTNGSSLMYAVGQADSARNMGQFYFVYSSAGSTSNRLSMGLHSVDDVFNILGSGMVGIGATAAYVDANDKLVVTGGRLAVNAGAYTAASFNRSTNGNITEFLVGGTGRGAVTFDGTNLNFVSFTGMNLYANSTTLGMFVSSSGNVGIGTATPFRQLTFGSANADAIHIRRLTTGEGAPSTGTGIAWTWTSSTTDNEIWAALRVIMPGNGNTIMTFSTTPVSGGGSGLTERMRIDDSGLVGIGTTGLSHRLELYQAANDTTLRVRTGGAGAWLTLHDNTSYYAGVKHVGANGSRYWISGMSQGIENYCIAMSQNGDTNRFFLINTSGHVGIGTTIPRGPLHIGGDLNNGATDAAAINLKQTSTTAATGIYLERSGERRGYYLYIGGALDALTFQRNNAGTKSDVMSLTREGNVGIGITSPSARLHVAGGDGTVVMVQRLSKSQYADSGGHTTFLGLGVETATWSKSAIGHQRTAGYDVGDMIFCLNNSVDASDVGTTHERMRIKSDGNVGIGNTSPTATLAIGTGIGTFDGISLGAAANRDIRVGQGSVNNVILGWKYNATAGSAYAILETFAGSNPLYLQSSGGNVGIGGTTATYKLYVTGAIYATGDIIAYSDARAKENVVTLDNALDKVTNLRGVYYTRKDDETKKKNVGVIAQEVLDVVPELVSYSEQSDEYAVKYQNITALLIEAIKEQQTTIQQLQARIEALETL